MLVSCPPCDRFWRTQGLTATAWELIHRPMHLEPFSIQTNRATGAVACLRIFPGIEPRMVEAVLRLDGLKGLVLEVSP